MTEWEIIDATKKHKKRRAAGGFIIGIKKKWEGKEYIKTQEVEKGLIKTVIKDQRDTYKIWSVCKSQNTDNIVERLDEL